MQVRGVAAFLKGKVTLSQSEGTHQFLSPEYHRFFTNKKKTKTKTKTILTKGGGEGGEHGHSRTPLAMPLRVISQYPIKFWRTFNRNPLISPTSRLNADTKVTNSWNDVMKISKVAFILQKKISEGLQSQSAFLNFFLTTEITMTYQLTQ